MNLQILKAPIANAAMLIRRPVTEVFNAARAQVEALRICRRN